MKRMNRMWLGLVASVGLIGVVAGVTLGVTTLLGVTFEESAPKPVEGLQAQSPAPTLEAIEPTPTEAIQTGRYPGLSLRSGYRNRRYSGIDR